MSPADAQARIDQIMQDKNHAYWNKKDTIGRQKAVQEVQDLYEMVSGAA